MQHLRTVAVLKRFAAIFPDKPFDAELTTGELMHLQQADPDLAAIKTGKLTSSLEASILEGSFSDSYTAPSVEQLRSKRVQEILAMAPGGRPGFYDEAGRYTNPTEPNLSLLLELSTLDTAAYERERLAGRPVQADPHALTEAAAADVNARLASIERAAGVY